MSTTASAFGPPSLEPTVISHQQAIRNLVGALCSARAALTMLLKTVHGITQGLGAWTYQSTSAIDFRAHLDQVVTKLITAIHSEEVRAQESMSHDLAVEIDLMLKEPIEYIIAGLRAVAQDVTGRAKALSLAEETATEIKGLIDAILKVYTALGPYQFFHRRVFGQRHLGDAKREYLLLEHIRHAEFDLKCTVQQFELLREHRGVGTGVCIEAEKLQWDAIALMEDEAEVGEYRKFLTEMNLQRTRGSNAAYQARMVAPRPAAE